MKITPLLIALAGNMLILSNSLATGDPSKGETLSGACVSCHGQYGLSDNDNYPNLAGQRQPYLLKALQQYQTGKRSDVTMQAIVGPLSAQDIEDLAAYFAGKSGGFLVSETPNYSYESQVLHVPVVTTSTGNYQVDMHHTSGTTFELTTVKPLP